MARLKARLIARPILTAAFLLLFVGVAAAAVPVFQATEAPAFCTTCHEMQPYYDAWTVGAHKGISCVECHVDAGAINHVAHKMTAAKELWTHLTGDPRFPQGTAKVPDARCLTCHPDILKSTGPGFSHAKHTGAGACVTCHSDVGHRVTLAALAKADVLKPGLDASATARVLPVSTGSDAVATETHIPVSCSDCHDLAKVACSTCHQPPHPARGECLTCHRPGVAWSFTHPSSTECASCHTAPAKHYGADCGSCHSAQVPFAKTAFTHTSKSCAECHTAPSGHNRVIACSSCHLKPGQSWAASHPVSTRCASCHAAPSRHYGSSCATCHTKPGVTFAGAVYRHTSSSCASCHKAPSGHVRTVSCATCHKKPGVSWAASHPASRACASCHKPPASHFGTTCGSCHKPMVAWTKATFSHPRAGEHSYRSFACVKCHPSGYSSHSCTCHGGKTPTGD
jgi:nitrate/TMAO reductase-like tetraheme cytochrome c subunit